MSEDAEIEMEALDGVSEQESFLDPGLIKTDPQLMDLPPSAISPMKVKIIGGLVFSVAIVSWVLSVVTYYSEGVVRAGIVAYAYASAAGLAGLYVGNYPSTENTQSFVHLLRFGCIGCTLTLLYDFARIAETNKERGIMAFAALSWSLAADICVPIASAWAKQHGQPEYVKVSPVDAVEAGGGATQRAGGGGGGGGC